MTTKEKLIQQINQTIQSQQNKLSIVESIPGLELLELPATMWGEQIDFDNLNHDNVIKVMQALNAGKWTKEPGENATVHYQTKINGMPIRMWQGEPPPNCRIIEELVTIPAEPEKVVTRRKLVCQ